MEDFKILNDLDGDHYDRRTGAVNLPEDLVGSSGHYDR